MESSPSKRHIVVSPTLHSEQMKPSAALFVFLLLVVSLLPLQGGISRESEASSLSSWSRTFHLHEGAAYVASDYDWMNSSGPANPGTTDYDRDTIPGITIKKNIPPQRWHHWVLWPPVDSSVTLTGNIDAHVWAKSRYNASGSMITAIFFDMGPGELGNDGLWTEIGRQTIPLEGVNYPEFDLCNFSISSGSYSLAPGHSLVLSIQRGDSFNEWLLVMFDTNDLDSTVVIHTSNFISVDQAWTEDAYGTARNIFSDFERAVVNANISNPFGAYDITTADVSVCLTNGSIIDGPFSLSVVTSGPTGTAYWKRFNHTLPPLSAGQYLLNVTGSDTQGTPTWLTSSLTVIAVDHFGVYAPQSIVAGELFSLTIVALDSADQVIDNWVGTVQLDVLNDSMVQGEGDLAITSVTFTLADAGQVSISNQSYNHGEELIYLRASAGAKTSLSNLTMVWSGPAVGIAIAPRDSPPYPLYLSAGIPTGFTVIGTDALGNENWSWTPVWTTSPDLGTMTGSGFSVSFSSTAAGSTNITCTNPSNGANDSVWIQVNASALAEIVITEPPSLVDVREGESKALAAIGRDTYGNSVDISGATWDTNTTGSISGTGGSAVYTAGYVPESGIIRCRLGALTGSIEVIVRNALYGPWFSTAPIPAQIVSEDAGSWSLSLTEYWHDINGTGTLTWWAEGVNTSLYFVAHNPLYNSILEFYTQPNQFGDDQFTLWAIDPDGYRAFQTITVQVIPVNDKPLFVNGPPRELYVRWETPYTFDYTYYVCDVDNALSDLEMMSSVPDVMFDGVIATFMFPKHSDGKDYMQFVTLSLSDLSGPPYAESTLVVWVTDDYPPALNSSLPDVELNEGEVRKLVFDLDEYFYDQDSSYLIYSRDFQHITVEINQTTHEVFMSALEEWSGFTQGTFMATDPENALKIDTVNVTVYPVNDRPRVSSPGAIHVRYDVEYYIYVSPYVNDPDNPLDSLTFDFSDSHVTHIQNVMGAHQLKLLFPPGPTGSYVQNVRMTVSDPEGLSNLTDFQVVVSDNYPPTVIADNPDQLYYSFAEDSYLNNTLDLYSIFSDDDDSTIQFAISDSDSVFARIFSNGVVNLTAALNWSGVEVLNITARDPHGAWASVRATVTVTEVNDAPFIKDIPDWIEKGGSRNMKYNISSYFLDSDDSYDSLVINASPSDNVWVVGDFLYVSLPSKNDVISVTVRAYDGELQSNVVTFKIGVSKTMAERIGWPYSFPLVLLAAGVAGYFIATRLPRPHALENLFLIHNDGRLIAHVTKEENTTLDKDVVSAMFTAVQEFVRDSFQKGEVGLKKLEIGDKNVMIEKGQFVYLALIYSGWPSKETFGMLAMLLRDIEERYKGRIEKWNGTMKSVKGIDKMLQEYMSDAYEPGTWHEEEALAEKEWVDILEKEG